MVERLRHPRRLERRPDEPGWVPWPVKPPRAHVGVLVFPEPVAARAVDQVGARLRERTPFAVRARVEGEWRSLGSLRVGDRDPTVDRVALFATILPDLVSDAVQAQREQDDAADRAYEREHGLPPPPELFASIEEGLAAWREALGVPCATEVTGSRAALDAELARVRAFCPFEFPDGFPVLTLHLGPRGAAPPPDAAAVTAALVALGFRAVDGRFRFDPPLGVWDTWTDAWVADGGCGLSVSLLSDAGPAAREVVELLLRAAAALERELGLRAWCDALPDADLAAIGRGAAEVLTILEDDGFFQPGALVPDLDLATLEALADERHDLLAAPRLRRAGRTLTLRLTPVSGWAALWLGCAVVAAIAAVFWPWAALGVVGCLALAALAPRRPPVDVALGLRELRLTTRTGTQRFRLPLAMPGMSRGHDLPVTDADGRAVPLPPYWVASGYDPAGVRALYEGLFVRNALATRPITITDQVALETLDAATSTSPGWARGRREGHVAVAIGDAGGLAFFEDQESLEAWTSSSASATPHRLGFVRIWNDSGKGASIGYPSEVEWGAPVRLNPRDRVFLDEGEW
jgi:hypothetical protein